jgi:hypothetical protein
VPSIDEFVNGFKFEVYSEGYGDEGIEDFCGWYEYTFGLDNWRDLDQLEAELRDGNVQALSLV